MTSCSQLIDSTYQTFDLHDTVSHVLTTMREREMECAIILDGVRCIGMMDFFVLEDAAPEAEICSLEQYLIKAHVKSSDHFLQALRVKSKFNISVVPVLNENNEWEGVLKSDRLLDQTIQLLGVSSNGALLVLEIPRHEYAPGLINRLVESNDCMIMQMNTILDQVTGLLQVIIRVNKEEISDLIATFQRHEFSVLYHYGEETFDNILQNNLDHLLNYLNI